MAIKLIVPTIHIIQYLTWHKIGHTSETDAEICDIFTLNTERPYKASLRISDIEDIRLKAVLLDNYHSILHFKWVIAHVCVRNCNVPVFYRLAPCLSLW